MPIDLKRDDLPLEMVDDLYENQPDWLHAFIHFLSTDESISDGITRMEGGSGWLSRILNTSLDKVKTPEETRKFLIENPFFTFLLSGKTPGEFQKLCDSGELSAEVDKILGSPEDEAGDSIFAQFNQGKIFEWADTLGARVYAVLFNEKGEVRTEILGALDGQGLKELRDAGIINIDNDSTKSQIFTSLCMPLVGLLATYVNQTVKAGIEKNKKLLSEEKDEIMKRYVKSVGDTVLLDSINPNDLPLTEAIT